jgi:sugar/nucleoside kinase (ribokinase family)
MLGANVSFLGKVGMDSYAAQISAALKKGGVDISNILKTPSKQTGLTVALNFDNDRAMVTYPGAMNELKLEDIADEILDSASHMHLSSIFLQEGLKPDVVELFKKAKSKRMTTSLDTQWDPKEKWDINLRSLLPYVDVFLPNASELKRLTSQATIEAGLETIKSFCNVVVVKNGTKGAIMWDKTKKVEQNAFLNEHVVDAIGAGDSFNAGFISQYIKRRPLEKCLEFGAVTGAINTTAAGGTNAFKSLDYVKKVAKEKFNYTF